MKPPADPAAWASAHCSCCPPTLADSGDCGMRGYEYLGDGATHRARRDRFVVTKCRWNGHGTEPPRRLRARVLTCCECVHFSPFLLCCSASLHVNRSRMVRGSIVRDDHVAERHELRSRSHSYSHLGSGLWLHWRCRLCAGYSPAHSQLGIGGSSPLLSCSRSHLGQWRCCQVVWGRKGVIKGWRRRWQDRLRGVRALSLRAVPWLPRWILVWGWCLANDEIHGICSRSVSHTVEELEF